MASYKKLVRDKIPEIIKSNGEEPIIKILNDIEYKKELEIKLLEECNEVIEASGSERLEEIADLYEVIKALLDIENSSFEEIKSIAVSKEKKRGAFKDKIYLEGVK